MNTFTIDLSDVLLYTIPFVVIWVIMYKIVLKNEDSKSYRIFSSAILTSIIYFGLIFIYSVSQTINFKIQL